MRKLTHHLEAKVGAIIVWAIAMLGSIGGSIMTVMLAEMGFYSGIARDTHETWVYDDNYVKVNNGVMEKWLYRICMDLRYWLIAITVISIIIAIVLLVFLLCSAGRRRDTVEVTANWVDRIPLDLLAVIVWFVAAMLNVGVHDSLWFAANDARLLLVGFWIIVFSLVGLFCLMTLATRIKLRTVFTNTLIYRALKWLRHALGVIGHSIAAFFRAIPLLWKSMIILLAISFVEFCAMMILEYDTGALVFAWLVEKLILVPILLIAVLNMKRLQTGGRKLAAGQLEYRIATERMLWDFKRHGENLNSISEGMNRAVEGRLKSERFKTELITNVSHDIKTPLTSIINYVDLISKENIENEKVTEYIEVLDRQSKRLKKLIEDLVEASKASTGNISAEMCPTAVGVLLQQAAGEYDGRMNEKNLELILNQPQDDVTIMADGRLLWRVFDNLLSNICKYAMSGTRVYLNLERIAGKAIVTFRNISAYPLNLSSEELMERFARGDSSRHTEGSGLGLSIAKSLTELQKGEMDLYTDGDLFKVVLTFPQLTANAE